MTPTYKISILNNYISITSDDLDDFNGLSAPAKEVRIYPTPEDNQVFEFWNLDGRNTMWNRLKLDQILDGNGDPFTLLGWVTFYTDNTSQYGMSSSSGGGATAEKQDIGNARLANIESSTGSLSLDVLEMKGNIGGPTPSFSLVSSGNDPDGNLKPMEVDSNGSLNVNVQNASLSSIDSKTPSLINGATPVLFSGSNYFISSLNSSTSQLTAGSSFTGTLESVLNYPSISLLMVSNQDMVVTIIQSIDAAGTKLLPQTSFTVYANTGLSRSFPLNGNYVQIKATNIGSSSTTNFELNTAYGVIDSSDSTGNLPVSQATQFISGSITTQNLVPNGSATSNSAVEILLSGTSILSIQVTGTYTGALSLQVTNDNVRWETVTATSLCNFVTGAYTANIASGTVGVFIADVGSFLKARITGLSAVTGTALVTLRSASIPLSSAAKPIPAGSNAIGGVTQSGVWTVQPGNTANTTPWMIGGAAAHSAAASGNPVYTGGKIVPTTIPTIDTTLVAGDASAIPISTSNQKIVKPFGTSELDYHFNFSTLSSVTTVQQLVPSPGSASIRNYITGITLQTDTLGASGNMWIMDGSLTVSSIAISTGLVTTSSAHDLKVGDSIVFTSLASGTGVSTNTVYYVNLVGSATTFNFSASLGGSSVVPSVAYTGTTMYRILHQLRLQITSISTPSNIIFQNPIRGLGNSSLNILIPSSLTSGSIFLSVNGYRNF